MDTNMAMTTASQEDEALVYVSLQWPEAKPPGKQLSRTYLEKGLQSWFNKWKKNVSCTHVKVKEDGCLELGIKPATVIEDLLKMQEIKLEFKDCKTALAKFYTEVKQIPERRTPDSSSTDVSPLKPSAKVMESHEKNERIGAAIGQEEMRSCTLPFSHFLYVDKVYEEEMKRIERENGVKLIAEVNLSIKEDQKSGGNPNQALLEVISLVQRCFGDSVSFSVPLKHAKSRVLEETLKIVEQKKAKLLLLVSSEEITVHGPSQSVDAIQKYLKTPRHNSVNSELSAGPHNLGSQDTSLKMAMNIKDHLVSPGVTMDKNHWKEMNAAFCRNIANINAKFGVEFVVVPESRDKVNVKPRSAHVQDVASLECHALRALLHLYQKFVMANVSRYLLVQGHTKEVIDKPDTRMCLNQPGVEARSEAGPQRGALPNVRAPRGEEEETCPICMDAFTNKKKLKCTHEFCEECLIRLEESMGKICPVCKTVYGKVEGDQPDGKMSVVYEKSSLPGYPNNGSIKISYNIPSGIQTKKHPKPGTPFQGIGRTAYLPNNTEGNEVLILLKRAFNQKLIFTVGTSRTTGAENQVTWNDIHHKTCISGGPERFGYPDPGYLRRVRDELKSKGIE